MGASDESAMRFGASANMKYVGTKMPAKLPLPKSWRSLGRRPKTPRNGHR